MQVMPPTAPLSEREIDLIRLSFQQVADDMQRAGEIFYERLFALAPETRDLFLADMGSQAAKLMNTLGVVVAQLQSWQDLAPVVEDLALRHVAYGVRPEHYAVVGEVLDIMLREVLEDSYDKETRAAWRSAYGAIADAMIGEAYRDAADDEGVI